MSQGNPQVRFLRQSDGKRLAYAVQGSGPPLVCPAWWVSHLEDDWKDAGFRQLFGGLAECFTVVRYDRPGAGLSDRQRVTIDLEGEISTLSELVDHLELERFALFAVSCAGPPALGYAAKNPERISRLVFFGSFIRGADVGPPEIKDAIQALVRAHWGAASRTITNFFAPNLSKDDVKRVSRSHRAAASPEMAAQLLSLTFDVDVHPVAASVVMPTLVLHRRGDNTVRHEAGRELAASLPNATFETLEGDAHVPWIGEVAEVRDAVARFLGAETTPREDTTGAENELRRSGDVWTLTFGGRSAHFKHGRGLTDLAVLLTSPGREVHVAELWSGAHAAEAIGSEADPVLDEEALTSYKARLREVERAITDAEEAANAEAAEGHRQERDALAKELRAAVGLGGRKRRLGQPSERARKAVSARIRASIKKVRELHPELGEHLETSITTGNFCIYAPSKEIEWRLEEVR